ncbi:hypothetical protein Anapl_00216 [Anas platyrhynchos]|uniref:Uncharacterized protein n=1 Tax=Anas platyrhynchos TaxID=8839 RepID=R0K2E9_ANAPL|nr:hypothetical protein Anapl_00216 [Anas platyrhynchos]
MQCVFSFTASNSGHGGNGDENHPCTMANTAGHFCYGTDHDLPYGPAPRSTGDLENAASASDLAARPCVSQPCIPL